MEIIIKIITALGGIVGIAIAFNTLFLNKLNKNMKTYELYKSLKTLSSVNHPNNNLAEINVIVSCLTSKNLTLKEVKWFVNTPNAYKYIEQFGRLNRYIEISETEDSFSFKGKYKLKINRVVEFGAFFLLYLIFGGASIWLLLESFVKTNDSTFPLLLMFSIGSFLLALMFLIASSAFSECKKIIRNFSPID